jgi:hypothetical protein
MPAGWYQDPSSPNNPGRMRFWNGAVWGDGTVAPGEMASGIIGVPRSTAARVGVSTILVVAHIVGAMVLMIPLSFFAFGVQEFTHLGDAAMGLSLIGVWLILAVAYYCWFARYVGLAWGWGFLSVVPFVSFGLLIYLSWCAAFLPYSDRGFTPRAGWRPLGLYTAAGRPLSLRVRTR